ncbi:MAG: ZIP family metal transporter [Candidatus Thorarchaeota archaeon]
MTDLIQLLLLGAIAGFTIFLGFPLALLPTKQRTKGFLVALATGILIFLVIDVFEHAWESVETSVSDSLEGIGTITDSVVLLSTMFVGIAIGLVGLAIYEVKYMNKSLIPDSPGNNLSANNDHLEISPSKLALMIAIGIGAHNLSEGLAIGQSFATNEIGLALLLVIGFGAHNATEGFGIIGPLGGSDKKPSLSFLIKLGLIGGGPTFVGTLLGSLWISSIAYVLFLSLAGGALIFVILLMYRVATKTTSDSLIMLGIFIGLSAGFLTDLLISIAGA